ncbi:MULTISPECIES: S8 family serine peptidase [Pseudidiomarina]|uniref:PA domain-containing protein n=2 Tax=Pseudidiomarina TaxID=2800384 RepID=A0A368UTI3_9GAMM|nr:MULTISPECIES: S8 family serine peptidase [Pseudidiomarina]PWW12208.1 PA domain-containing protein [Pseudidiomarina maritima]RBP89851.1 PA domain-containing protein [Pseudidiomarina tainanensis]RCW31415.1 PA domain-containing protein [Pseudidiomarina tainanensis]
MTTTRRIRWSSIALAVAAATGVSTLAAQDLYSSPSQPKVTEQSAKPIANKALLKKAAAKQAAKQSSRYLIELEQAPVATYKGGIAGYAATSAKVTGAEQLNANSGAARAYANYLRTQQQQVLAAAMQRVPGLQAQSQLTLTFNGIVVEHQGAGDLSRQLRDIPGVKAVHKDYEVEVHMDSSNSLINSESAWALLGGQEAAGKGVNVAIIDTGIDFAHPMFADNGHDPIAVSPGDDYCATNVEICNDKIAVARFFGAPSSVHPEEFMDSPQDMNGHGSHVAGTAAGNPVSATIDGVGLNFSGVAPGANLLVYKALWNTSDGRGSGLTISLAEALEAAAADGADVINNSWGGGAGGHPASSYYTPIMQSLDEMGVVTVTSAGNSGPGPTTVGCPGCIEETITVASTQTGRIFANQVNVTGFDPISAQLGNGEFSVLEPITAELLPAIEVDEAAFEACEPFAEGAFAGKIAMVSRGTCSFEQKANTVQAAGAVGMIVYNNAEGTILMGMGAATLPSISITQAAGQAILAAYDVGMEATINPNTVQVIDANVDALSDFSSRGPNGDPTMLKPEIAAPGSDILSAAPGQGFAMMSGTSMAGPHVAGAAALVMANYPEVAPQQVKSILMTSSAAGVRKEDTVTLADPFDVGAGRLDLATAMATGVTFDVASFAHPMCVNECQFDRTITSLADAETVWNVSAEFADTGMSVELPATVTLAAGETLDFDVTFNGSLAEPGWQFGTITLSDASGTFADARLPVAVYAELSTDSSVLTSGITAGEIAAGQAMTATMLARMGDSAEPVTMVAQFPQDESFVVDAESLTVTEVGTTASEWDFNAETRTFTWTGDQTDDPAVTTIAAPGDSFPFVGLSLNDLQDMADIGHEKLCVEGCDEAMISFNLSVLEEETFWTLDGVNYSSMVMWENGVVEMGENRAIYTFINQDLPNPATPNGIVAPFWADYEVFAEDGELRYSLINSTDGTRYLILEWYNVRNWNDPTGPAYTFNAWFELNSDKVYVNFIDVNQGAAPDGGAVIGLENIDGTAGGSNYITTAALPANGSALEMSLLAGTPAQLQVDVDVSVTDFGDVAAMAVETGHSTAVTVDLSDALGEMERDFATLLSVTSGDRSAEAVLPINIKPTGTLTPVVTVAAEHGSVSFDGMVATYTPEGGFEGTDSFSFHMEDEAGATSASNTVTVTLTNTAPVAAATAPASAEFEATVQLDASGSTDADGDTLTYSWSQTSGPSVSLTNASQAIASFVVPGLEEDSNVSFTVTVSDGMASSEQTVTMELKAEPKSSSSFAWWLSLLALPLVWLRRRK